MKKIISALLCLAMLLSLAACANGSKGGKENTNSNGDVIESYTGKTASIDDTVEISVPLDTLDEKYQNDLQAYCDDYGYDSAKLNRRKGTVTVVMNELKHDLLLTDIGMKVVKTIYSVEDNKDYPYVDSVKSYDSENFSKVVLAVDGTQYKSGAMAPFVIGQACLLYQLYDGTGKYKAEVEVVDKDSGSVIETKVYTDREEK